MNVHTALCLIALNLVAGCGGSALTPTGFQTLWQSPARDGAALIRARTMTSNSVALVEDVGQAGKYRSFEVVKVISETRNIDGSSTGEVVLKLDDGTTETVRGRFFGAANLFMPASGPGSKLVAGGPRAANLPTGSFRYAGYAKSLYTYDGLAFDEDGSFTLEVQFASDSAQLTASTPESHYSISDLTINESGELAGQAGRFVIFDTDGETALATRTLGFNGTFHGDTASHVSGIAVGGSAKAGDFSAVAIVGKR